MPHSLLRISRVQARQVNRAKAEGLSSNEIERQKRSGEAAVVFARQILEMRVSRKRGKYCRGTNDSGSKASLT